MPSQALPSPTSRASAEELDAPRRSVRHGAWPTGASNLGGGRKDPSFEGLIAEDDAVSREILKTTVKRFGHECLVSEDGLEAWETYQSTPDGDVIISDRMMPNMDGLELCRRVRGLERGERTFVIFLTALGGELYIVAVVMLQALFRIFVGGVSQLAVVASTLLFAVLLYPARLKLRDLIDGRLRTARTRRLARQHSE